MKKLITSMLAVTFLCSGAAFADDYREVWECTAKEGKSLDDIQAINSKWLAWMRKNVDKNISSAVLTAVIGKLDGFIFVDTYPSLEVWGAGKAAQDDNDDLADLFAEFDAAVDCGESRLWRKRPTP